MSAEYVVLFVEADEQGRIDGQPAEVFMRFTEEPSATFLARVAASRPGERVYCLLGASTWHEASEQQIDNQPLGRKSELRPGFYEDDME